MKIKFRTKNLLGSLVSTRYFFMFFLLVACGTDGGNEINKDPSCTIVSPKNGSEITIGEVVKISINSDDSDGTVVEVRLFVNDIGISSLNVFPYNFDWDTSNEKTGSFIIKATSKDNSGNTSSTEIAVFLKEAIEENKEPVADFKSNVTEVDQGKDIQFSDLSLNNPTSWLWDFGDGNSSELQHPSHAYLNEGIFNVSLTVSNESGSDTESKADYIQVNSTTGTVTDFDGNIYKTVKIGDQWWMAENLKTTHYSDGRPLLLIEEKLDWQNANLQKAFGYYEESSANVQIYGALYNQRAAMDSDKIDIVAQGVCPSGWHIPSHNEWKMLEMELGMSNSDLEKTGWRGTGIGGKLKEVGTSLWQEPNNGATNESGFSAIPGGWINGSNSKDIRENALFLTSNGIIRALDYEKSEIYVAASLTTDAYSIRCIKDE